MFKYTIFLWVKMKNFNKTFSFEKAEVQETEEYLSIKAVVSSTAKDLDGDIIESKDSYTIPAQVKMLENHNGYNINSLIGYWENPAFETKGNVDYLTLEGRILKTTKNLEHVIPLVKSGILNQFSIGFSSKKYEKMKDGGYLFKQIEIHEVSIVGFPANQDTQLLEVKQKKEEDKLNLTIEEINKTLDEKFTNFDKSKENLMVEIEKKLADNQKITQEKLMEMISSFGKGNQKQETEEEIFIKGMTQDKLERKKTLNSFSNPEGGYLVPTGFSNELIREIFNETGDILSLANTKIVNDKSMQYPVQLTSPKARWYNEGDFTSKSNSSFKPMDINIRRISAGTDSTWEGLNYQSSYTKQSIIFDLKEAIKTRLSYDMLYGETSTGGLQGILTSNRTPTSETATTGVVNWKDFNNMFGKVKLMFNLDTIVMHRETWYYLMNQASTTGEPIYRVFEDYQAGALVRRFMGKNVVLVGQYIDETDSSLAMLGKPDENGVFPSGSNVALYGDFKAGYRLHVKKDITLLEDDKEFPSSLNTSWFAHMFTGGNIISADSLRILKAK